MPILRWSLAAVISAVVVSTLPAAAKADFLLESQKLSVNPQTRAADFSLTFNQTPAFTLDSLGRPTNSFQIDFNGNYVSGSTSSSLNNLTGIVRGDEIHVANTIPVRAATGVGGANSGGWGPVVGSVPFSLIGDTVSFSVPAKELGWTGRSYEYEAMSFADGRETASQRVTMVPTPVAFRSGLAGLIIVGGVSFSIRRRNAQRMG